MSQPPEPSTAARHLAVVRRLRAALVESVTLPMDVFVHDLAALLDRELGDHESDWAFAVAQEEAETSRERRRVEAAAQYDRQIPAGQMVPRRPSLRVVGGQGRHSRGDS